jgi:hypothetical protein
MRKTERPLKVMISKNRNAGHKKTMAGYPKRKPAIVI